MKPRILIIGFGNIGTRVAKLLLPTYRVYALIRKGRDGKEAEDARQLGVLPVFGDLDNRLSLARLASLAPTIFHFAPPPATGKIDSRTKNLIAALSGKDIKKLIYISTTGVYGDCGGAWIDETRALDPQSSRAIRRVDAELRVRAWAKANGVNASILRAPGIYSATALPVARLQAGTPAICDAEDSYSNHIHADDLARAAVAAMLRAKPQRAYNICDDSTLKMGEYFDMVAKALNLPKPPRLPRAQVQAQVSPMLWSFMQESRRINNQRMREELKFGLKWSDVAGFLSVPDAAATHLN